jgi:hypothetical protein
MTFRAPEAEKADDPKDISKIKIPKRASPILAQDIPVALAGFSSRINCFSGSSGPS